MAGLLQMLQLAIKNAGKQQALSLYLHFLPAPLPQRRGSAYETFIIR